jgi:hypothetical protein
MNMPAFTAQASLYSSSNRYRPGSLHRVCDNRVHPADCYSDCRSTCYCSDLVGNARGACWRACNQDCHEACDPPPVPSFPNTPPPPPPVNNCIFGGEPCVGKCCPIGTVCCGGSPGHPDCRLGSNFNDACLH